MKSAAALIPVALLLCSCAALEDKIMDEPRLSPVSAIPSGELTTASVAVPPEQSARDSEPDASWIGGPADFFRDARPRRVGDLIAVNVTLDDSASFRNTTSRSRKSANNAKAGFDIGMFNILTNGEGEANIGGGSSTTGQGSVIRSEKLKLQLTATIREVLPNGNFLIEGAQQVLVNHEMRDIRVAGVVDPRDIAPDSSVDYNRMADARVQYGGRGTSSTAQKPGWGTQLWDKFTPF